jgi:hypothetical protein
MNIQDEYNHPVGEDRAWSESYYFNFYDPASGLGMFTRMGLRPNEGWCDGLHAVYLGGDRVAFTYSRENLPGMTDNLQVGGLKLERLDPFKRWAVSYKGPAQDVPDAAVMITRRRERPEGWFRPAELDMLVEFEALTEPHYAGAGQRGHFEQTGAVKGTIRVDDMAWDVSGWGVRDKSWGPRTWQSSGQAGERKAPSAPSAGPSPFTVWFSMNWGADMALGCGCGPNADGELVGRGWVQNGKTIQDLAEVRVTGSTYKPDSILHTGMNIDAVAADGTSYAIKGDVMTICPTKIPMAAGATFVNEGLARFILGDRAGYGIAEYWHAVEVAD